MNGKGKKNVAASVRQRLLDLARKTGEDFQLLLTRYAIERLLFRLGKSEHEKRFVLKGAMLFALWTGKMHRPTRDLDLLGFGQDDAEVLGAVFRSLYEEEAPDDGLRFDATSVKVEPIREDQEYGGERMTLEVRLENARVTLQVDVGFGDAVTPGPLEVAFPTLLGMEAPRLRAYPRETVVAEKLEAMVKLGLANSRMKDFYDVLLLERTFPFEGRGLSDAIRATFTRRGAAIPRDTPVALTETFGRDQVKVQQWRAFVTRSELTEEGGELPAVVGELAAFLVPPMTAAERGEEYDYTWPPGGPWRRDGDVRNQ